MKRRILGRTGLEVSELGYGGWAIGGNAVGNSYGSTDDTESRRAVRRAFELGCNFFDTADVYGHGHSEELIGAALHDVRAHATEWVPVARWIDFSRTHELLSYP